VIIRELFGEGSDCKRHILPVVLLDPARWEGPCIRIRRRRGHGKKSKDVTD
jgi:hypothetical protein